MTRRPNPIRAVVAVIVLIVLFSLVWGWWGDYRDGKGGGATSPETTATVEPPEGETEPEQEGAEAPEAEQPAEPPAADQTVVVLIEGLNFRQQPSRDAELIRGLGRGTRLEYLGTTNGWYHVRDDGGTEGYVSASEQYTELQ